MSDVDDGHVSLGGDALVSSALLAPTFFQLRSRVLLISCSTSHEWCTRGARWPQCNIVAPAKGTCYTTSLVVTRAAAHPLSLVLRSLALSAPQPSLHCFDTASRSLSLSAVLVLSSNKGLDSATLPPTYADYSPSRRTWVALDIAESAGFFLGRVH